MCALFNRWNRQSDRASVRSNVCLVGSRFGQKLRRKTRMRLELLEDRQLLATLTVNTTADGASPDATLSLRQAIDVSDGTLAVSSLSTQEQAQVSGAVGTSNIIDFNIPTSDSGYSAATGVWTIAIQSALPAISTNAAIINGYSQPGALENTLAQADNAKLVIAIDGAGLGTADGLTIGQPGSQVSGLDIENFLGDGIVITSGGNVQVSGNFIGIDPTGETAAPNGYGVVLENSLNTIGGPNVGDRNVISGNSSDGYGVYVPDQAENPLNIIPTGNLIENNFIGTDAAGTKGFSKGQSGVADFGSGNTYGGTTAGLGNVISGNAGDGLKSTGNITIEGNFVGTDATGNAALGNGGFGLACGGAVGSNAAITIVISNNVVSGNGESGISVQPASQTLSTFTITNNLIGTNAAGTAALGNASVGLQLGSVENATVLNNLISGNNLGVQLSGFGPDVEHNVFQGNLIGTDKTGLVALGNTEGGMYLSAAIGNAIGGTGPGQGNVIAFNGLNGIYVSGGDQNLLTQNSVFGNTGPGIQFVSGANGSVAAPVMTFTPGAGGSGTLAGTLTEKANATYIVEVFSNPSVPVAGQEQGKTFVQDVSVSIGASGKGSFSVTNPQAIYTATATDPSEDTSPFSNAVGSQPLPATMTAVSSSLNPSTVGQQVTFTAVVTAPGFAGTPAGSVTFTIDGQARAPVSLSVVGGADEAQFVTSTLTAGQNTVTAAYGGNTNVGPSSGSLSTQVVNAAAVQPAATMTALESSLNPSTVGEDVTLTAVVTAPGSADVPTGTVSFTVDGQEVADVALSVVGGIDEAQVITSALTVGQHSVTAAYGGDTSSSPSTASLPTQVVNATAVQSTATTTALESSLNPSMVGEQVTFTAVVTELGSAGVPTGAVTFTIDGQAHAPVSLSVIGGVDEAKFVTSTLTAGQHSVAAAYSGDTSFASSTVVSPLSQVVNRLATSPAQGTSPTVLLVQRFGVHMHPTVLMLTFSSALDPSTAENVHNYRIVDPSGRRVAIESAVYNATANTVTLQPAERINLHHTYQLMVIGSGSSGVAGADHALLDGVHDGDAGSNFVTTLNWKNVVLTPAEFLKIHAASGAKPAGALVHRFVLARR
jgi:parallel beta-helix repeat protein